MSKERIIYVVLAFDIYQKQEQRLLNENKVGTKVNFHTDNFKKAREVIEDCSLNL